jgi:hypothetical protein
MHPTQFVGEDRHRPQQQHRMKLKDRAGQSDQCNAEQTDSRSSGLFSQRLKPSYIVEFVDNMRGKTRADDRHGENR